MKQLLDENNQMT